MNQEANADKTDKYLQSKFVYKTKKSLTDCAATKLFYYQLQNFTIKRKLNEYKNKATFEFMGLTLLPHPELITVPSISLLQYPHTNLIQNSSVNVPSKRLELVANWQGSRYVYDVCVCVCVHACVCGKKIADLICQKLMHIPSHSNPTFHPASFPV